MSTTMKTALLLIALFLVRAPEALGAGLAAPTDVIAVPTYGESTSDMHVSWDHSGTGVTGFRVRRRETGSTSYVMLPISVPPAEGQLRDLVPSSTVTYEYQVRAVSGASASSWSLPSPPMSVARVWPLRNGTKNILHNFGQPIKLTDDRYFHAAVDITAEAGAVVQAAQGGLLGETAAIGVPGARGGFAQMDVKHRRNDGSEFDEQLMYGHMNPDPGIGFGDPVEPGEYLGTVSAAQPWAGYTHPVATHLHWGGSSAHPLLRASPTHRDPGGTPPLVRDVNGDGRDFLVVSAAENDPTDATNLRSPAWGNVDFLVDACDDMTPTSALQVYQAPAQIGYWISKNHETTGIDIPVVRSSTDPYVLTRFAETALEGPESYGPEEEATLFWDLPAVTGLDTWTTCLTWIVTNSADDGGDPLDVLYWNTDARINMGEWANKSDAWDARDILEAHFPDGMYRAHIWLADLDDAHGVVRRIKVDNFCPFVKMLEVFSNGLLVYSSVWTWESASEERVCTPSSLSVALAGIARPKHDVEIRITFSEPMRHARMKPIQTLGYKPDLWSDQPKNERRVWHARIPSTEFDNGGADDGVHWLRIFGRDLAGNRLAPTTTRDPVPANHGKRDSTGTFSCGAGFDSIHCFEIGRPQRPSITPIFLIKHVPNHSWQSPTLHDALERLRTAIHQGNRSAAAAAANRALAILSSRPEATRRVVQQLRLIHHRLLASITEGDWVMARYWMNRVFGLLDEVG